MKQATRPFRFGIQMRMDDDWIAQARRAEALGYDVFLMPDHFGRQFAIAPALATVAAVTSTIRIGTLVYQNDLRHPTILAQEAATLDVLSGGRFELGIGAGGSWLPDFTETGIAFDPPGVRVRRLAESVTVLKGLFGPDPLTYDGEFFHFAAFQSMPKPVQQPLPILVAGGGKRSLAIAAEHAQIIGLLPAQLPQGGAYGDDISIDTYREKSRRVLNLAGDRVDVDDIEFNLLVQMLIVTDNADAEIARLKAESDDYTDAWFASAMVYVGTVEEIAAKLRLVRERAGVSYFTVFWPVMETFAPILASLKDAD